MDQTITINITIVDTGVGIAQEDLNKLFKVFGKLENTSKINTQGIGIGLTICKSILAALGGTISVESEVGKGSQFTITMTNVPVVNANGDYISSTSIQDIDLEIGRIN